MSEHTSITERTRSRVDGILERLREEYGTFEVVEKTWERSPSELARIRTQFEQDRLDGAGVWLTDAAGEVLLVRNEGDAGWADPGGKVELGENYATAARRELREETGVDCELTGIRELHEIENVEGDADGESIFEVIVVFDGDYAGGEPRPRDGEIAEIGWFSEPPEPVLYEEVRTRPYPTSE
jgi:ADP-ribose pyrophosphatase YjhB (NUDIX family)